MISGAVGSQLSRFFVRIRGSKADMSPRPTRASEQCRKRYSNNRLPRRSINRQRSHSSLIPGPIDLNMVSQFLNHKHLISSSITIGLFAESHSSVLAPDLCVSPGWMILGLKILKSLDCPTPKPQINKPVESGWTVSQTLRADL